VQKALSGVARMSRKLGPDDWSPRFGKRKIIQCLMGSQSAAMRDSGLDELSTHGILKREGSAYVDALFECIERAGLLQVEIEGNYPLLKLTPMGSRVMRGAETIGLELPERTAGASTQKSSNTRSPGRKGSEPGGILDRRLYGVLVGHRAKMAAQTGKPAFTVFPNSVLVELANKKPQTKQDALEIKGIGLAKVKSVLPEFLRIIQQNT